ncbi:phage baseplate assembly protein V [Faunimonas pinastri]|uniref:Phage baseplate assembly protein V n=1 Tax=Faunimonas pinastri TaxID=1855383 RepID=A0A1H9Q8X5_9HYPH|nr:phage baseplate assembly protein [Faunimonas pinastri]SER56848.1 phage baseplate assembly protein V [Faunimonas pinastri]
MRNSVRDIAGRGLLGLARAVLKAPNDATKMQSVAVRILHDEAHEAVEHWHPYGFFSVPLEGAEALVGFLGGSRSHPIALAIADRRHRPQNSQAGEVGLHDDQEQLVHLTRDGIAVTSPKKLTLTVGSVTFTLSPDGVDIQGGTIKHNGKSIGSDHQHTGVKAGSDTSGPPSNISV